MSRIIKAIGEYKQMVVDGFKNRDQIIEAISNAAKIKNAEQGFPAVVGPDAVAEIIRRKDICALCPHNSRNAKETGLYASDLPFEHCTLCRCRIGYDDSKEYCLSCTCGADAWNKVNPDNPPMEVKWQAFKP